MPPTDFGYMEEGKLGKAYDLKLMARLGSFLRPYWLVIGVSLILILIMAGLDLVMPYLTKEAIDRYIVSSAREVVAKGAGSAEEAHLLSRYGRVLIPTSDMRRFLIPPDIFQSMDRKEVALLQKAGILTENRYYLFSPRTPKAEAIVAKYPSAFERTGKGWSISFDRMKELSKEDLIVLRGADIEGIFKIALLLLFIMVADFLLNFFQVYLMEVAGQRVMHDLRMKVFSHVQNLPISFFDKNPVGRLVTRQTNDIQNIHEMFTSVLVYLLKDILLLVGIVVVLLHFNRPFALVSFSVLPLIFVTTLVFSHRARDAFRDVRLRIAQLNAYFQENFSGIKVVQLFRRQAENERRFNKINDAYYQANMKQISVMALFVPLIEVVSSGAVGLLLWYGGGKVLQDAITLGVLVAFLSYMRMFFQPIRDLSEKYTILQSAMASMERVFLLLDEKEKLLAPSSPGRKEIRGQIEFKEVSFSYDGEDKVLKEVSFSVRAGEVVAVVGATGAGKTSLIHLLERFYDVGEGAILVDDMDIHHWNVAQLRSQIGLVMQDTFLFSGDIEENIRLGGDENDGHRVRQVAQLVNADRFIRRLPNGYRTKIGEGGETISAGEMQLLAFARALYSDPKILILDEATSHVDPETERLIQEGLARLLKGRTAIVIAHRLSTIQHADKIVVMHKGRVREVGKHDELMAKRGLYYKFFQLQYGRS